MPSLENLIPGGIFSHIAAYGSARDLSALSATSSRLRLEVTRVVHAGAAQMQARADAAIPAAMGAASTNRRNALSENAVGRVLYIDSLGHCIKWEAVADKSPYLGRMDSPHRTPDFIYRGRIADAVSVNFSTHPHSLAAGPAAWRNTLLPSVLSSIEGKWQIYGAGCIAAVDITSFPDEITTAEVSNYLFEHGLTAQGGRNAFLIRGSVLTKMFAN